MHFNLSSKVIFRPILTLGIFLTILTLGKFFDPKFLDHFNTRVEVLIEKIDVQHFLVLNCPIEKNTFLKYIFIKNYKYLRVVKIARYPLEHTLARVSLTKSAWAEK